MKVILKEDVKYVGKMGQIVDVADGYARNYLIPKGLVAEASTKNIKFLEHEKRTIQEKSKKIRNSAQDLAHRISSLTISIKAKAGEEGKLFGSITTMDVAEALQKEGVEIDKKKISLEEPIKRLGSYTVNIKLHPDVSAPLNIQIVEE
ncbi:MAG TPA: 50S ribosomal protein L9 [Thermodesulfovibrionales bacterium]|nr:50S ribosomal protein L9 [Thermodesulfovibrionales bacterium]